MADFLNNIVFPHDLRLYLEEYRNATPSNRSFRKKRLCNACVTAHIDMDALLRDPDAILDKLPTDIQVLNNLLSEQYHKLYLETGNSGDYMERLVKTLAPEYENETTRVAILKKALPQLGKDCAALPTDTVCDWAVKQLNEEEKAVYSAAAEDKKLQLLAAKLDDSVFSLLQEKHELSLSDQLWKLIKRICEDSKSVAFADDAFADIDTACLDPLLLAAVAAPDGKPDAASLARRIPLIEKLLWLRDAIQSGALPAEAVSAYATQASAYFDALVKDIADVLRTVSLNGCSGEANSLFTQYETLFADATQDIPAFLCELAGRLHRDRLDLLITNADFCNVGTGWLNALLPASTSDLSVLLPPQEKCCLLYEKKKLLQNENLMPTPEAFADMEEAFISVLLTVSIHAKHGIYDALYNEYLKSLSEEDCCTFSARDAVQRMLDLLLSACQRKLVTEDMLHGTGRLTDLLLRRTLLQSSNLADAPALHKLLAVIPFYEKLELLRQYLTPEAVAHMNKNFNPEVVKNFKDGVAGKLSRESKQALREELTAGDDETLPVGETVRRLTDFLLQEDIQNSLAGKKLTGSNIDRINAILLFCVPEDVLLCRIPENCKLEQLQNFTGNCLPLPEDPAGYPALTNSLARLLRRISTQKTLVRESLLERYKDNKGDRSKKLCNVELLRFADDLAKGVFRPNGTTKKYLYYFAYLFDLTYAPKEEDRILETTSEESSILDRDLETLLFFNYYAENALQTLLRKTDGITEEQNRLATSLESADKVLSCGVNLRNYAEMCYLYYLVGMGAKSGGSAGKRIDAAESMIRDCKKLAGKGKKTTPRTDAYDHTLTRQYQEKLIRILNADPDGAMKILAEEYVIPTAKNSVSGINLNVVNDTNTAFLVLLQDEASEDPVDTVNTAEIKANLKNLYDYYIQLGFQETDSQLDEFCRTLCQKHNKDTGFCRMVEALRNRFSPKNGFLQQCCSMDDSSLRITRTDFLILLFYQYITVEDIDADSSILETLERFCGNADICLSQSRYQPLHENNLFDAFLMLLLIWYVFKNLDD